MRLIYTMMAGLFISGCASNTKVDTLDGARDRVSNYQATIDNRLARLKKTSGDLGFIEAVDYPIISATETSEVASLPSVFNEKWTFNPNEDIRLVDVIKSLQSVFDLVITVRDDVYNPNSASIDSTSDEAATVNVINEIRTEGNLEKESRVKLPAGSSYNGDLAGFFDYFSSLLGVSWKYDANKNKVVLARYVQKSYRILAGASSDIWSATESTINEFRSEGGGVKSNPSAGILTVVDTEEVQAMVSELVDEINESSKVDVSFRVEIISASLSEEDATALGINLANADGGKRNTSLSSNAKAIPGAGGITLSLVDGVFSGSQFVAESISKASEVTNISVKTVYAANNTTSVIDQTNTVPVITGYTPPVITETSTVPATAVLEEKQLGFKMSLTPTVYSNSNNIRLLLELDSTELADLTEVKLNDNGQFVQRLSTVNKKFNQVINIDNNTTRIIALEDDRTTFLKSQIVDDSWFSWLLNIFGTSKTDTSSLDYYLVAVTPTVMSGSKL